MTKIIIIFCFVIILLVSLPHYAYSVSSFDPVEYDVAEKRIDRHEWVLRFSPHIGYTIKNSNNDPLLAPLGIEKNLKRFQYILLNAEVGYQMYRNWFATVGFVYNHSFYQKPVDGGLNIYGIPFGVKYVLLESDYKSDDNLFLDRARYWFGIFLGPYIRDESITVNLGARTTSGSDLDVAFGTGAHTGFDYFLTPNFGLGIELKFHYIYFDDDIIIFSGGPSIIGRF